MNFTLVSDAEHFLTFELPDKICNLANGESEGYCNYPFSGGISYQCRNARNLRRNHSLINKKNQ